MSTIKATRYEPEVLEGKNRVERPEGFKGETAIAAIGMGCIGGMGMQVEGWA